jgi:hypothetical protein
MEAEERVSVRVQIGKMARALAFGVCQEPKVWEAYEVANHVANDRSGDVPSGHVKVGGDEAEDGGVCELHCS